MTITLQISLLINQQRQSDEQRSAAMSNIVEPVPVPSHGVIVNRTGKYRYVYKVLRVYRNDKGRPTNDRVSIGVLTPDSDKMMIPNERYYHYYQQTAAASGPADLQLLGVKSIGASFLISKVLEDLGVSKILHQVLDPLCADSILTIANYMVCRGNVIEDIEDWCNEYSFSPIITPQNASLLFSSISSKKKMEFFKSWLSHNNIDGYLAYDVTSFSTYAKKIVDAQWDSNLDGEKLPQINLGCYLSYKTNLPIFYLTYPGSIIDISNIQYITQYNKELNIFDTIFIMDNGFCSTANLRWLHAEGMKYVMEVDTLHKTTRTAIEETQDSIDKNWHLCGDNVYGIAVHSHFYGVWGDMYVYFNPDLQQRKCADLYRLVGSQKEKLEQMMRISPHEAKHYQRFYNIKIGKNNEFTYSINQEKMTNEELKCGFYCIFSNSGLSINKVHEIYKNKVLIEKGLDDLKNHIDMKRLRIYNDDTTNGKVFCAFIALIAALTIEEKLRTINERGGSRRWSKCSLIGELEKIKVVSLSGGHNLMNSLTKTQLEIIEAFGFNESDLQSFAGRS
jgi:transposase